MKNLFFLVLVLVFTQAYSQKFTNSHTVGDETKTYSKILVVVKAKSNTQRVQVEDDIVKRFKKKGVDAVASNIRISESMLKNATADEETLKTFVTALKEKGFEGILVTSLVEEKESVDFQPAQYRTTAVPVRYGRFGRYYGTATVGYYDPGSYEKHKNFILEALLYDLRGSTKENSLHWIGKIKITDPTSFDKASDKYAKKLVKRLVKEAIDS